MVEPANRFFVNVEVVIARDDRYLLIVRGDEEEFGAGWLTMPGGTAEWDAPLADALEATARREVREEVGLVLDPVIAYVESHTFGLGGETPCFDVVMLARPSADSGEPWAASPGEVASLHWMTCDEACRDDRTQPWTRESLRRAELLRKQLDW